MPRTWPHGLDCEAFTFAALERAAHEAREPHDREHVTPWLRRAPGIGRVNVPGPGGAFADRRWTLDFPEDYTFFKALFAILPPPPRLATTGEMEAALRARPDIAALNAGRHAPAA
jgi:spore coat polysaccharide biosynthesis protein SpsF (cytidylyltransferase family)